jgi:hypothetical protein
LAEPATFVRAGNKPKIEVRIKIPAQGLWPNAGTET